MAEDNPLQFMAKHNSFAIACFISFILGGWGSRDRVAAQVALPPCQPPQSGELLILVTTPTPDARELLRRGLPEEIAIEICEYRNNATSRIGGFKNVETANSWGRYINDILRLQLSIAHLSNSPPTASTPPTPSPSPSPLPPPTAPTRPSPPPLPAPSAPSASPASPAPPAPSASPAPSTPSALYNPSVLGAGYAVIIDYFDNPEVATQLQQLLGRDIGLVSYFARPYLIIQQTRDPQQATFLLQELSDRGFSALIVNSRQTVLLTSKVANP